MYIFNQQESIIYQQKIPWFLEFQLCMYAPLVTKCPWKMKILSPKNMGYNSKKEVFFWGSHAVYSHGIHGTIAYFTLHENP